MSRKGDDKGSNEEGSKKEGPAKSEKGLSPTARRQRRVLEEKLELIRQQVEDGTLTVRKMTPEERARYPARPRKKRR